MINILITHEESQSVTKAFRKYGIIAYSCDIKPCSGGHPEWHIQGDAMDAILSKKWDFIGMHPVCTKMALSGNRSYAQGKERHSERIEAVKYTLDLWNKATSVCDCVYMENPMGAMNGNANLPKPQVIHPYYFGDPYQKMTCLWLHGLPPLEHRSQPDLFCSEVTHTDKGDFFYYIDKKTGKQKRQPLWFAQAKGFGGGKAAKDVQELRSKTFPGIANAMANQWSLFLWQKQDQKHPNIDQ